MPTPKVTLHVALDELIRLRDGETLVIDRFPTSATTIYIVRGDDVRALVLETDWHMFRSDADTVRITSSDEFPARKG